MNLAAKTKAFRELHERDGVFLLPNAWDAASARLVERAGFPAVATSSAAVAAVLGSADEEASWDELLVLMRAIGRSVELPVTFDIVQGFAASRDELLRHMDDVLAAGGSGINLEDGFGSADDHAERIVAIRKHLGDALVINARVDVFIRKLGDTNEAIRRGRLYRAAGADSVFMIGVSDEETIDRCVQGVDAPINILASPASPSMARLRELGVRRVSLGSGVFRAQVTSTIGVLESLRDDGNFDALKSAVPNSNLRR
jgi:2-methylisocitrate lyase-like PEP mutase family enzyme